MSKEREDKLEPTQPTLIVRHGNTRRKYRRLEQDATILGRAPGCDLGLMAPDVAPVHCVIVRGAEGWRVRDCTGRGATHLNGHPVRDEVLRDEDLLQIGGFSFALHLPPEPRRLADPAGEAGEADDDEGQLATRQEELDRQADELNALRNDLDARLGELRRTRQEVADERAVLQKHQEQVEKGLSELREAAKDDARRLVIRAAELGRYADHLRRVRRGLRPAEVSPATRDTVVDVPSPLHRFPQPAPEAAKQRMQ